MRYWSFERCFLRSVVLSGLFIFSGQLSASSEDESNKNAGRSCRFSSSESSSSDNSSESSSSVTSSNSSWIFVAPKEDKEVKETAEVASQTELETVMGIAVEEPLISVVLTKTATTQYESPTDAQNIRVGAHGSALEKITNAEKAMARFLEDFQSSTFGRGLRDAEDMWKGGRCSVLWRDSLREKLQEPYDFANTNRRAQVTAAIHTFVGQVLPLSLPEYAHSRNATTADKLSEWCIPVLDYVHLFQEHEREFVRQLRMVLEMLRARMQANPLSPDRDNAEDERQRSIVFSVVYQLSGVNPLAAVVGKTAAAERLRQEMKMEFLVKEKQKNGLTARDVSYVVKEAATLARKLDIPLADFGESDDPYLLLQHVLKQASVLRDRYLYFSTRLREDHWGLQ